MGKLRMILVKKVTVCIILKKQQQQQLWRYTCKNYIFPLEKVLMEAQTKKFGILAVEGALFCKWKQNTLKTASQSISRLHFQTESPLCLDKVHCLVPISLSWLGTRSQKQHFKVSLCKVCVPFCLTHTCSLRETVNAMCFIKNQKKTT